MFNIIKLDGACFWAAGAQSSLELHAAALTVAMPKPNDMNLMKPFEYATNEAYKAHGRTARSNP